MRETKYLAHAWLAFAPIPLLVSIGILTASETQKLKLLIEFAELSRTPI
jgi:hypothetical protein